jgi:hypothetical protein
MDAFTESYEEFVRRTADKRCMQMVARVMKACGVTQVDISNVSFHNDEIIAVEDHHDQGYF